MRKILTPYLAILRPGHWFKNLVVFFGIADALFSYPRSGNLSVLLGRSLLSFTLACIISSVNYTINDIADAKGDAHHPVKKNRLIPTKRISKTALYYVIIFLLAISFITAITVFGFGVTFGLALLFCAGIFYNIKPLRFKDVPFLDVIVEAVNNPIRILIGWFTVVSQFVFPSASFLLLFWVAGAALMAAKRYAELQFFLRRHQPKKSALYRLSFRRYTLPKLYAMVVAYLLATMALFVVFSVGHKTNLLYTLPLIVIFFGWFLRIMDEKESFFREPETVFVKKPLFFLAAVALGTLFFVLSL